MSNERRLFALNFLRNPLQNASLVPSSRAAARAMLSGIDFSHIDTVIELGPGTGVFTEEIVRRSKPDTKIVLLELEASYVHALRKKFGVRLTVEHTSAHALESVLQKHRIGHVDLIVSGLPTYPHVITKEFVSMLKKHTDRGTIFRFFTYIPPLMKRIYKDLPVEKRTFTFKNFPPLFVYGIH